jgi:hypothetical protein
MHPFVTFFQQWRYLFLLGSLIALLVVEPISSSFGILQSLFEGLFVVVLAVLVLFLIRDKVWRALACLLCLPAATLVIVGHFLVPGALNAYLLLGHAIGAFFLVLVVGKIIHSILASQELTWDSVFGAICGYLLLGTAWGLTYAMIFATNPDSFLLQEAARPYLTQSNYILDFFLYYSFVTLTTVGYGDVTPVSIPARTLSWIEAVSGQLYLAVLIAGLINGLSTTNTPLHQDR